MSGGQVQPGNPTAAQTAIREAADTRRRAHEADPRHRDPAWQLDPVSHSELLAFFEAQALMHG
jgi:hypothetical protein